MDKCREEFEKQRYWIGLFRDSVYFDPTLGDFGSYVANGTREIYAMDLDVFNARWESWAKAWQSQQEKVDDLQKRNDKIMRSIDWHIEDCEMTLWMNGNDYYIDGFKDAMSLIKKYLKEEKVEQALNGGYNESY